MTATSSASGLAAGTSRPRELILPRFPNSFRPSSSPVADQPTVGARLHILPKGFVKVRNYGGFSNTKRQAYLERCRQSLGIAETQHSPHDQQQFRTDSATETQEYSLACPRCLQAMMRIRSSVRPSWRKIFSSSYRPPWYHDD